MDSIRRVLCRLGLSIALILSATIASSQKLTLKTFFVPTTDTLFQRSHSVVVYPLALFKPAFAGHYEKMLFKGQASIGLKAQGYFGSDFENSAGYHAGPFVRAYYDVGHSTFIFAQAKGFAGEFESDLLYQNQAGLFHEPRLSYQTIGYSIGIGLKELSNNWMYFDTYLGFRYHERVIPKTIMVDGVPYNFQRRAGINGIAWYMPQQPGSYIELQIGVGWMLGREMR